MTWFGLGPQVDARIARYIAEVATGGGGGVGRHAGTHIDGGTDPIDGDKLEISWLPTNYTRDSSTPSEASADDQLTAHLQGIDTQLASAGFDISALTADATPDGTVDYVATYDDSAATHKKVLVDRFPGSIVTGTEPTTPSTGLCWLDIGTAAASGGINVGGISAGPYTPADEDDLVLVDATSEDITVNLSSASSLEGQTYIFKKIDSSEHTVTIDGNSTETIDGSETIEMTDQYEAVTIVSDGTEWHIV